ncbi:MAG TPA: UDP-2,3-diacylglucosamine diphosphatase [Planctomycetes bacterium]|nr:UDP-2,3-diacylglucosamine diphosphatase [Planctomycetota bacterium]
MNEGETKGLQLLNLRDEVGVRVWADLHLEEGSPQEVEAFVEDLRAHVRDAGALVIAGDLFNAWTGRRQWKRPVFRPLAEALRKLRAMGTRVILLRGNRDVLLNAADGLAVGAEVADGVTFSSAGRGILLTHGDEYCLNDRSYQRLRKFLRCSFVRGFLRCMPDFFKRGLAGTLRRTSQAAVARKPLDAMALVESSVSAALGRCGADQALIGHLHIAEKRDLEGGKQLEILPAWEPGAPPWKTLD